MEDREIFMAWMAEMDWGKRGGIINAAESLGKNRKTIERYISGETDLPTDTRLAMTALAQDLMPWDPESEGLPAFHFSLSFGRS